MLSNTALSERVRNEIISFAKLHNIEKLVLFGSRARGDYKAESDIDLAIWGGDGAAFSIDVEEEIHTLLSFDIVDFKYHIKKELAESIAKEGIILYEKI